MYKKLLLLILLLSLSLTACTLFAPSPEPTPSSTTEAQAVSTVETAQMSETATAVPVEATVTASPSPTPETPSPTPSSTPTPLPTATSTATATPTAVVFAAIGDYGQAGDGAAAVATLVHDWEPEFIITLGDNNYPDGEAETIDENIGQYYAEYIYPYQGTYTTTSTLEVNRFFPSLGNHDYYNEDGAQPYLDYFTLPGNERYYDFTWGPVHLFALNSDFNEPDGVSPNSVQGQWLQQALAESDAPWKLVYFHVTPYSSGGRAGEWMRWPFREWGASAVLAGHDHHYERLLVDGLPYFVNGLGGGAIYNIGETHPDSQVQFTGTHGAMRIEAGPETITFEFVTRSG
ncbi:MAG: metallophosphoesterase family protein, partial [Chloroflexota bacterium]